MNATHMPAILVSTWDNGLFVIADDGIRHELSGQPVRGLTGDGRGGALAIVGESSVRRRSRDGSWRTLAEGDGQLACCMAVGPILYAGTDDARILRMEVGGEPKSLPAFEGVAGRDQWYAGSAIIDGQRVGPPLGIRSMTVTSDQATILANVHVGGIPRSSDGGRSWHPTIDIDCDVHQVCAHPTRPDIVAAAAAAGLCISRDGGITWTIESKGLHASYCSAVAFAGTDVLVSAAESHFATRGAIYRRPLDGNESLQPVGRGLPEWTEGIVDTDNIAVVGSAIAIADHVIYPRMPARHGRSVQRTLPCPAASSSVKYQRLT